MSSPSYEQLRKNIDELTHGRLLSQKRDLEVRLEATTELLEKVTQELKDFEELNNVDG